MPEIDHAAIEAVKALPEIIVQLVEPPQAGGKLYGRLCGISPQLRYVASLAEQAKGLAEALDTLCAEFERGLAAANIEAATTMERARIELAMIKVAHARAELARYEEMNG